MTVVDSRKSSRFSSFNIEPKKRMKRLTAPVSYRIVPSLSVGMRRVIF